MNLSIMKFLYIKNSDETNQKELFGDVKKKELERI